MGVLSDQRAVYSTAADVNDPDDHSHPYCLADCSRHPGIVQDRCASRDHRRLQYGANR